MKLKLRFSDARLNSEKLTENSLVFDSCEIHIFQLTSKNRKDFFLLFMFFVKIFKGTLTEYLISQVNNIFFCIEEGILLFLLQPALLYKCSYIWLSIFLVFLFPLPGPWVKCINKSTYIYIVLGSVLGSRMLVWRGRPVPSVRKDHCI